MNLSPGFIDFDDGQDDQAYGSIHKQDKHINRQTKDKYLSTKMQKNFFETNRPENWLQNYENHQQLQKNGLKNDQFYTPTQNRKRRNQKKLTPLNYQPKVQQIYLSEDRANDQQKDYEQSQKKQQIHNKKSKEEEEDDIDFRNKVVEEAEQIPKKIQLNTLRRKKKKQQIVKKTSQQQEEKQQKQQKQQNINEVEQKKQVNHSQLSQQNSKEYQNPSKDPVTTIVNVGNFLSNSLPEQRVVRLAIVRGSSFIGYSNEYDISFNFDSRYLLTAKKVSSSHLLTINLSTKKNESQQNGPSYVGKIKGNFMGTIFNIFSAGLNPQNALKMPSQRRQMLATIVYSSEYFSGNKPRQFKVYVKNPKYSYLNLDGVSKTSQPGLDELFNIEQNRKYIATYRNRKPIWRQDLQGYSLNFRGRVNQPSVKNFIMEINDPENEKQTEQLLLFGRASDNKFNLDISAPLSPIVGISVALTSFYTT